MAANIKLILITAWILPVLACSSIGIAVYLCSFTDINEKGFKHIGTHNI